MKNQSTREPLWPAITKCLSLRKECCEIFCCRLPFAFFNLLLTSKSIQISVPIASSCYWPSSQLLTHRGGITYTYQIWLFYTQVFMSQRPAFQMWFGLIFGEWGIYQLCWRASSLPASNTGHFFSPTKKLPVPKRNHTLSSYLRKSQQ